MVRLFHCDDDRHQQLLRDELPDSQSSETVEHVESCEQCRRQLELLAAEPDWWEKAKDCLPDDTEAFDQEITHWRASHSHSHHEFASAEEWRLDFLTPSDDPQMLGRIGEYEIMAVIGRGGSGIVLKGHQPKLGRHVAVKVLAPPFAASGAARQRFAREAQAAASVVHPHVLALHAVDATGPHPYLVMPFVDGESLQRRIDNQGPLPLVEVLRVGKQTADGLAAAHTQGLVHRDIKPANILLEDEVGRVLLTDFGLARAVDDATMTCSGVIAGTPQFMAPEQARGESLDHRADLFSLGSVLYAMSGGRPPFRAETTMGVLRRICEEHPRPLREINPDVPQWLEQLIQQLHAKQPDERIQSAQEVAELLGQCLAHVQQPQSSPLPAKLQRNERRMGWRQFVVRSLGAAALVAAVAVGTQHWWRSSPPADVSSSSQLQAPPSDFASEYHLWRELDTQLQAWDDEATQLEAELRDDWPGQATLSLENSNADLPTTEPSE